ncbi:MAG: GNAT family N-acetyltransferase [Anaerolineaceae bacterium]|nr:GNAT family N-acetyltransferase [Anaerolineaceae bacterium]
MTESYCDSPTIASGPNWLSQVSIREITNDDLPALEWDGEYSHLRKVYAHAFQAHKSGKAILWVAALPETGIIGQIFLQLISDRFELADGIDRAHIYSFRIKPEYRGFGLGSRMLDEAESFLLSLSFRYITLNVAKKNHKAQNLYERFGYQIISHESGCWSYLDEKGVWRDVEEPAWRMQKTLS